MVFLAQLVSSLVYQSLLLYSVSAAAVNVAKEKIYVDIYSSIHSFFLAIITPHIHAYFYCAWLYTHNLYLDDLVPVSCYSD